MSRKSTTIDPRTTRTVASSWLLILLVAFVPIYGGLRCMPICDGTGEEFVIRAHCGMDCCDDGGVALERGIATLEVTKISKNFDSYRSAIVSSVSALNTETTYDVSLHVGASLPPGTHPFFLQDQLLL